eukprot:gene3897-13967_t
MGRKVADTKPKRPASGLMQQSLDVVATAMVAWGNNVDMGVLSVMGRKVADTKPKRPATGLMQQPLDVVATAMVAWGNNVVMGDGNGRLTVWDPSTGKCTSMPSGFGMVRRMQVSPPPHPSLYTTPDGVAPIKARVCVLFSAGNFGVYELDSNGRLRAGHASSLVFGGSGKAHDIGWAPLPWSAGGGSVVVTVTEEGSISLIDVAQASDRSPSSTARLGTLRMTEEGPISLIDVAQALDRSPPSTARLGTLR